MSFCWDCKRSPAKGVEDYYGKDIFSKDDFAKLAGMLVKIKGKFILSINDVPEIRSIFKKFNMKEVETMTFVLF